MYMAMGVSICMSPYMYMYTYIPMMIKLDLYTDFHMFHSLPELSIPGALEVRMS